MLPATETPKLTKDYLKTEEYKNLPMKEKRVVIARLGGIAKKGVKLKRTVEKEKIQKQVESFIQKKAFNLVRAGMSVAMGQNFVYRIDEEENEKGNVTSRKNVLVTDPHEIEMALNAIEEGGQSEDGKYYFVTAKEPDHKAIQMLLDRGFGKAKETVEVNGEITFSLRGLAARRETLKASDVDLEIKE